MTNYVLQTGQSLFDVAVEVYGDNDGVFWLLEDNPRLLGLTDRLRAGEVLVLRPDKINPRTAQFLADFGPFATIDEPDRPVGVGYWRADEYQLP